ncbi:hypothetical protein [Burkholderia ambifaria]|uniref:hypothetical protein n=1 Tax=Burkholderia ambifaria TaxID=152480 RepID=UPI00158AB711|nr:hypothetical protein [Burkholderia ambifaria]WDR90426.1 hypothetical protein OR986_16345 [Burkholderia ambifaria]WDS03291.1 hypothetical protein OR985_21330 [Burkholderia ambifaria]
MASPEEGPGDGAASFANDRAMTAGAPQSAIRAMALREVRNDDEWARPSATRGPRVYRRRAATRREPAKGAMARARWSFAIKMPR